MIMMMVILQDLCYRVMYDIGVPRPSRSRSMTLLFSFPAHQRNRYQRKGVLFPEGFVRGLDRVGDMGVLDVHKWDQQNQGKSSRVNKICSSRYFGG